jgi:rare lipoprotein A
VTSHQCNPTRACTGQIPASAAILALATLLVLGGCSFSRGGGYFEDDGPGKDAPDLARIPDAVPRNEPYRAANGRPYSVNGVSYAPLADARDYRERGVASWYGKKFHGNSTASGERYDMYAMSAAHKTLPLPSYVRVRNLDNGRAAIVRVNDRGPFLHNRLIDLSYAAAAKLGIVGTGTGLVEIETVGPGDETPVQMARPPVETRGIPIISAAEAAPLAPTASTAAAAAPALTPPKMFVQAGSFREWDNAEGLRTRLERLAFRPIAISSALIENQTRVYRVRVGPVASVEEGDRLTDALARQGVPDARIVVE